MIQSTAVAAFQHSDRRRAGRVPLLVRVECKTPQTYIMARCENISVTGILVSAAQTFDVSQEVMLRFVLPPAATTGMAVQTGGVVTRAENGKFMAFQFVGLREPFREAIMKYIEKSPR